MSKKKKKSKPQNMYIYLVLLYGDTIFNLYLFIWQT